MTAMTMFAVKTNSPYETARLSGMAQSGGYLMSAFGPSLYGMAFAANPVGNIQNVVYVVLVMLMLISCVLVIKTEKI
jgi:Cyanate permease